MYNEYILSLCSLLVCENDINGFDIVLEIYSLSLLLIKSVKSCGYVLMEMVAYMRR